MTPTGNPPLHGVIGFEPTPVRSYKDRKEIAGAACDVQGVGYTAELTTPGLVNLPDQRSNSQPVTVTCIADGVTRTEVASAYSKTSQKNSNNAAGSGLLGAAIVGVYNGVRDKSNDDWGYPEIRVRFD
ncbi:hypothetical protein A7A09_018430 [Paracoccus methylarcula]|uniref:Uncharacterized protein n=1 Tax=Paracoccus methylarcula TaxID=72022 RepID=A0A3R7PN74_9RHOB|nr:hypothetical protein A7A09_018430 [Paracoccus methylarcula]